MLAYSKLHGIWVAFVSRCHCFGFSWHPRCQTGQGLAAIKVWTLRMPSGCLFFPIASFPPWTVNSVFSPSKGIRVRRIHRLKHFYAIFARPTSYVSPSQSSIKKQFTIFLKQPLFVVVRLSENCRSFFCAARRILFDLSHRWHVRNRRWTKVARVSILK